MSLSERTPWEMVQEFFRKSDGKTGNYTEVELKTEHGIIKLYKNFDGSITVYDPGLEFDIARGRCDVKTRILIEGRITDDHDILHLTLVSASNIILSRVKHGGNSYYKIELEQNREKLPFQ